MTRAEFIKILACMVEMNADDEEIEGLEIKDVEDCIKVYNDSTRYYIVDGKKVYTTDVIVENFQFLDSKASRATQSDDGVTPYDFSSDNASANSTTQDASNDPFADFGAKIEINDSDLPF